MALQFSYPAYPSGADVLANIAAAGLSIANLTAALLDPKVVAAVLELERRTGFKPFLGDTAVTTHAFDPPKTTVPLPSAGSKQTTRLLDLRGGFWAVTEVRVGVMNGSAGTVLTLDTDYKLLPLNAALEIPARGWTHIEMTPLLLIDGVILPSYWSNMMSFPGSVTVAGKRGWGPGIPADVWQGLVDFASAAAVPAQARAAKVKEGPVEIQFSSRGGDTLWDVWTNTWEDIVSRYERIVV